MEILAFLETMLRIVPKGQTLRCQNASSKNNVTTTENIVIYKRRFILMWNNLIITIAERNRIRIKYLLHLLERILGDLNLLIFSFLYIH
jgi:hypothetical protein